jgi:hypothetical protein
MQLTIGQLIKIIIGVVVVAVVVMGIYLFFKGSVFDLFKVGNESAGIILGLIK